MHKLIVEIDDESISTYIEDTAKKRGKSIKEVVAELLKCSMTTDDVLHYRTFDPISHSQIIHDEDLEDVEETDLFIDVVDIKDYSRELRKKAWK